MDWFLIAYLIGLIFLVTKLERVKRRRSFRRAWIAFALIPVWHFLMGLFRAGNLRNVRDLQLIEVWSQAVPSLLLGISLICLVGAFVPAGESSEESG